MLSSKYDTFLLNEIQIEISYLKSGLVINIKAKVIIN
jgi:hypothetical protein